MFIYSKEKLPEAENRGKQLFVTYFEENKDLAEPILNVLADRGTTFTCFQRNRTFCTRDDYVKNVNEAIERCRVGVVMLSKAMFEDRNNDLQQLLWYEVGYMVSHGVKIVLFFLDIDRTERNDYLSTTPVRQLQGTDSVEELISLLGSMSVEEKIFYDDPVVNKYAARRISYVKITSLFNIFKKDLHEIFDYVREVDDEVEDINEVLDDLLNEIQCGCTVMRFNTYSMLGKEVEPYYPEVETLLMDFPIKQHYIKPILVNNNVSPEIYATVRAEFIIPIHCLLGVTFKPFMAINRISHFKPEHVMKILRSNSVNPESDGDMTVVKQGKEQRVYFLFEVDTALSGEKFSKFGEKLNHIWPA